MKTEHVIILALVAVGGFVVYDKFLKTPAAAAPVAPKPSNGTLNSIFDGASNLLGVVGTLWGKKDTKTAARLAPSSMTGDVRAPRAQDGGLDIEQYDATELA